MRSRFSAFAVADEAYLLRTWHTGTRPRRLRLEPRQRWTRLTVLGSTAGGLFDQHGTVEFRAGYQLNGESGAVHENSAFARQDGAWVYFGPVAT